MSPNFSSELVLTNGLTGIGANSIKLEVGLTPNSWLFCKHKIV
jgi:hypothetical protein